VALGRAPEAAPVLEQARAIFARLEAAPALADIEALIASLTRDGSAHRQPSPRTDTTLHSEHEPTR
jgi:hypothetical protein